MKLNIGCGTTVARGWQNLDNSPSIWLARVPMARKLLHLPPWPDNVRYLNVLNGLPFPDSSVEYIYSSHTFEHFTFEGSLKVAKECWRVLKYNGVLRIVVPDLRIAVNEYLRSSESMASHQFVQRLLLGGGLRGVMHSGNHHHQMFDARSLEVLFRQAGFQLPEVKQFRITAIPNLDEIEAESRRHESLYVEATKNP